MDDGVLYEIQWLGNSARVSAIDPKTGVEATIVAPANATEFDMKALARRKLVYLLNRRKKSPQGGGSAGDGRGGIVV
ncbi:DUF6898 family protein [Desertibaculum subflavum]|uniref:DUF6898 family protein n=1 Tax=Desertibaculum subflavum TaxID=2268458 RepID=UPI000E663518